LCIHPQIGSSAEPRQVYNKPLIVSTRILSGMALTILSSNRVETLQETLCQRLREQLPADPFATEIIVVPTYAMARWLNLQIARQQGIAANIHYPLPAEWVWQLGASILEQVPENDPLQPKQICWKLFNLIPTMLDRPTFAKLRLYLTDDEEAVKRWQLAARIATVFDRYQLYRPEWIRDWSTGGGDWQAELWRELILDLAETHRGVVIDQLIKHLSSGVDSPLLPERISLFGLSSLPPLLIDVIHAVASQTEVTLYQHSPTNHYWADLRSKKSISKRRLESPQDTEFMEEGNDLLASWGRQGQAFQDLLLSKDDLPVIDGESYHPPGNASLLQSIQQSIFELDPQPLTNLVDSSLSVHICHSPMRECQVLHDQLLAMIDLDPDLDPEDILVMIPEISRYAPYIEAVFQSDAARPTLPWNLSDISLADEHPLVLTFLQLLKLPSIRFTSSELIAFLDIDEVRNRFDIDEQALDDICSIIDSARVRWGIGPEHKAELGLPATLENTWQQAQQRMFAGYAFGGSEFWDGIAAMADIDTSRAQSMGKFWLLFDRLSYWHEQLSRPANAREWQLRLNRLLEDFFRESTREPTRLQQIRDSIDELALAGKAILSPSLLRHWLEQQLGSQQVSGRLFSGGITFCGMRPMRSLPFKVICLLGMNDKVFPRRENHLEFDRMASAWRPGDPSYGDEDRYLMLETLLCARQAFYLSYCGRSLKDNSACQPSVLVRELLDFVDQQHPQDCEKLSQGLTTLHPMQAFAAGNYQSQRPSYDTYWCAIANQLQQPRMPSLPNHWLNVPLKNTTDVELVIRIEDLRSFLVNPLKSFFNKRLRLWLDTPASNDDEENFSLDSLDKWHIKQRLATDLIANRETSAMLLQAEGWLPHGHAAQANYERICNEVSNLLTPLDEYRGIDSIGLAVDCQLDDHSRLSGSVSNYYPGKGLMHFTNSDLKGNHLLALWLDHLVLSASDQFMGSDSSLLFARNNRVEFSLLDSVTAITQLRDYVLLYRLGQQYPLPIFPLTSFTWIRKKDTAAKATPAAWNGSDYNGHQGDKDDPYVKLAMRGNLPIPHLSEDFEFCATRLYALALEQAVIT
jgi:exodeoxyribonuclease V gamma subunit